MNTPARRSSVFFSIGMVLVLITCTRGLSQAPANDHFQRTWQRTDAPVASAQVDRTWMWGPEAFTGELTEQYIDTPGGERRVQYFDKSRMEVNDPDGDPDSPWHVTNGLLVVELMSGRIQTGDDAFQPRRPSVANIAGDTNGSTGPTYATLAMVAGGAPLDENAPITWTLSRQGAVGTSGTAEQHRVTAGPLVTETNHRIASVFWEFMNSVGPVWMAGEIETATLFSDPFYATGYPITEAYWTTVQVDGEPNEVLVQAFERRILTYTPGNEPGWQVEAGNVGQHYYAWRYSNEDLPSVTVTSGEERTVLQVEVADTSDLRSCGLMHRYSMLENQAMLFVFNNERSLSFFNRNTEIPLQLAWIAADGTIVGLTDMVAADRSSPNYPVSYRSPAAAQYVIEANTGWFTAYGIAAGDHVDLATAIEHGSRGAIPICEDLGYQEKPVNQP